MPKGSLEWHKDSATNSSMAGGIRNWLLFRTQCGFQGRQCQQPSTFFQALSIQGGLLGHRAFLPLPFSKGSRLVDLIAIGAVPVKPSHTRHVVDQSQSRIGRTGGGEEAVVAELDRWSDSWPHCSFAMFSPVSYCTRLHHQRHGNSG